MNEPKRPDVAILRDVREELVWDARVEGAPVNATIFNGLVTLKGTAGSWSTRLAAEEAARRIRGVVNVVNHVVVNPKPAHSRRDSEVAQAVRHALEWDVRVPDKRIRSMVSDGVVTLEGEVDFWSQFEDAERCVRALLGVREVKNLIVVGAQKEPPSTHELRANIDRALARHIEHAAAHVEIQVEPGKVTLRGHVPSWAERQVVEGAVRGTKGVSNVESYLTIR
jgi:osmotically-inducible protein OsmY